MASVDSQPSVPSLAIIDDYLNTSAPHFSHIPASQLQITTFTDTISPTNEASTQRLVERLRPFTIISTVRERTAFPASLLQQLPNLKLLLATGPRHLTFDLAAAKDLGITAATAPGVGRSDQAASESKPPTLPPLAPHSTVQHTWALILALARNVAADDALVKGSSTGWQSGLAISLPGRTLGVIGLGRLGAAVARLGHLAWGMRVVCWSESMTQERADGMAVQMGLGADEGVGGGKTFKAVGKEELFRTADVVSVHYVLSERSRGLVGERELGWMKPGALLVNTSRGPLVEQEALQEALEKGGIGGAALDVFDVEPLPSSSPWRRAGYWGVDGRSRLLTTPHMGYVDEGVMNAWYAETAENVERWLRGEDVVNRIN